MALVENLFILIAVSFFFIVQNVTAINYRLSQPQIYVDDGHLYLVPAEHRNLVLVSNGTGKIILNDVELNNILSSVKNSTRDLKSFKKIFGVPTNSSTRFVRRISQLEQRIGRLDELDTLNTRLTTIERAMTYPNSSTSSEDTEPLTPQRDIAIPRTIRRRLRLLERRVRDMSATNPCSSSPCQNDGKCIPTVFGPFCLCAKGWEGDLCNVDVNECNQLAGTGLGCQNGAVCVNQPGTYQCQCRSGWFGIHCTQRSGDCSSGPAWELCGHGICVNQHAGSRPYTCICEQGWKTDGQSPACNTDIDECSGPHTSCSKNPPVTCINVPGSFHCGPCPPGYTGNGFHCTDINECLQNNGGCSTNPMVQCLNTVGSRTCGECPPGYVGNGMSCQYMGMCQINNGGCHPLARCIENPVVGQSFVQCLCPPGYAGSGMGNHGCSPSGGGGGLLPGPSVNPCATNPCVHGTCIPNGNMFICTCQPGFIGQTCSIRLDPCQSGPCQNGGTCQSTAEGFTCHCPNDFTGLRCETQEESCGGSLTGLEGTLRFPHDSSQSYGHNTNCMWWLRTDIGKVLNVTFTRFHLEGGGACGFDWLQIHDGSDSRAPLIGKFCGEELPMGGTIMSTHEALFLWFRSDHSMTGLGFELEWNATEPVCGGAITGLTHGSINSPGYPGNYPHNRDCVYTITVSLSKRIQLVFATLQIENHPNCSFDYLQVRDGLEEIAPVLGMFCNTTLPPPVVSSGPYLQIRFHTDSSESDMGFHLTFAEVPGVPGCGGVYTESQGILSSPAHPEPYAHGLDCEYLIRLPSTDERIILTFLQFELESGPNCRYDHVEIRDGNRPDSPLVGRFCERNMPPVLRSTTNSLLVRFRSDSSVAFGGFQAKYESVCGGTFSSPDAILRSPYYPGSYPKDRSCVYVISQPVNKAIRLDFSDFDIEGNDNRCYFDYLEVRDGDTENSTLIGHFCGGIQAMPAPIISTYNYLWIRFKTDGSVQNRGFLANYSTFDIGCGGILRDRHGVISSPGHPEVYPHGVKCQWIIRGVPGQVIRLNWVSFSLERNLRCRYDAVEIYDNSTILTNNGLNGTLIGRYCGQELPPIITSSDYTMTITFISDHSVAHDGFMANYVLVNSSTVCGGNYFTHFGVIRSPGFPNRYPNGKSCTWTIRVPPGQQIMLNVTDFDLENGTMHGCTYDSLEIRNGGFATSPLIGKYCGNIRNIPAMLPSFSNTLYLKFTSDSSRAGTGFQVFWDGTSTGCGGTLKGPSGSLVSPNYPMTSGTRSLCIWTIAVNPGSAIQFFFVDLDLQRTTTCYGEHVEVRDGGKANSPLLGKFCSAESLLALNSTSNLLRIKFVSGPGSTGRGFHASYQTICNKEITGHSGVIESPNFPEPYPHRRNCTWRIVAPLGNKINMSFSHFSLEASSRRGNCTYDYLEITESATNSPAQRTSLGRFCGDTIPAMISSTKDNVFVHFETDSSHARSGFRMEWVLNGCGGRILGSWGVLKSPNYPNPYPIAVECEWLITTEIGTRASLTIGDLDMEAADNCVFDYLRVYGGPTDASPLLTQVCHKQETNVVVTAHGNNMFVRFRSDSSVTRKGFYGWSSQLPGGCGGLVTAPTGFIYSPNYPNNYDHDDDCGYLIRVAPNHVVELNFLEFNIERHINCSYDHVAIYDGRSIAAPLLMMACGTTLPEPSNVKSTGNEMYLRLKTDGSTAGKGFKANYTTGCGARIIADSGDSGELTSPGFPHFIYRMNCTWFIKGSDPADRVTLTFTHMDIQTQGNQDCERDFVEVLDGEDLEAPSLGKFCFLRIPPAITSQANGLVVRVLTEDAWGFGFRANYDLSSGACGGTLTSAHGSFMTPGYPSPGYPSNAECIWNIVASAGNRVELSFRAINIETSDFCNTDFVEIRDTDASGPLLGHYCGSDIPTNISVAEKLWVMFRTDADGQAPGFLADYSLSHGNELSGSFGTIESPLYPMPNHVPGDFSWRIVVNQSRAIEITFSDFDLGYDITVENCHMYMKIYDGYDENAPVLLYRCDRTIPTPVISTGNVVYISVVKTYPRMPSMFQLHWQEVPLQGLNLTTLASNITGCGGNVSVSEDGNVTTLLSPNYNVFPGYPPNLRCEWTVNAIGSSKIQLRVADIDLEPHATCQYDRVEIYDGVSGLANFVLNQTLCQRSQKDMVLESSGSTMKIVFITDHSVARPGFNFSLTAKCGGFIRDTRGRITTPNYPQNYDHAICTWIISVRPGRTIGLTFQTFDIYRGSQSECSTDQLMLRNGGHSDSPFLGQGRYCGQDIPVVPETSGNQLYIQFSSWTAGGRGFALVYNEISAGCGGQIHLTSGAPEFVFSSPDYPRIPPPFTECEWIFMSPSNEVVQIDFLLTFQLYTSSQCSKEGVEVRDGGTRLSPLINTFCNDMPGTQKSTGNILYVRYYTTINEPRPGFKAKASIGRCGGTLVGWQGTIEAPGYPNGYEPNLDCLWTIKGPLASYLTITIDDLQLSPAFGRRPANSTSMDSLCTKDWLRITEENIPGIEFPRNWTLCGPPPDRPGDTFITSSSDIQIKFHSDGIAETRKGFKLTFRASTERCGATLTAPSGTLQSVGYPTAYPHYRTCFWKITAPVGRRIRLEFQDFDLEERIITPTKSYCVDYVSVGQGPEYYSFQKFYNQTLCGPSLPAPVETTSNMMNIRFRTDGSVSHRGFKASYTTDLPAICGGDLTGDLGNLSSPTTRTGTPNTTTGVMCSWKHEDVGGNGSTTMITLTDLRIPPWSVINPDCSDGFLKATPSSTYGSYNWRKFCGQVINQKTYLPGSAFEISYQADHWESTFNLTYQIFPCGGVLRGPNATVQNPGYPAGYVTNLECIWVLDYPGGSQIKLTFTDLDLEDHRNDDGCDQDYIIVRNGRYPSSPVLGKYCGSNLPPAIISMSAELWLEFHSDENGNGNRRGFAVSAEIVQKGCGGVIHKKNGALKSPKSPATNRYPANTECEWIIETIPGYVINLAFTGRFDIENSTNCTNDFVEIFQKQRSGPGWKSLARYCGKTVPPPMNTSTTSIKVVFRSNEAIDGDGFRMNWYSPCGGLYTGDSGVIRSAHFDRYNHSMHVSQNNFWGSVGWENRYKVQTCDYTVQGAKAEDYIIVTFKPPFDVSVPAWEGWEPEDTTRHCPSVNVSIWEGNVTDRLVNNYNVHHGGLYCGQEVPNAFLGRGAVTITYNYLPLFENFGFRAEYNIYQCGGIITEPKSIQSPGHPFTSAPNMNCTWLIRAPTGKVVRFKFEKLDLEYGPRCQYDSVNIFNGELVKEEERLGTFCGNLTEDFRRISSKSNTMTVQFVTDWSVHHSGFLGSIDFTIGEANGCGGLLNASMASVSFRSPDADGDGKYDPYLDCQWLAVGADYQVLDLTFNTMVLEGNRRAGSTNPDDECPYDYLEVRDGPGPYSALLGKFCGTTLPPRITSSTNFLWLNFISDGTTQLSGFRASLTSRSSPCGTNFVLNATANPQMLKSPGYDSQNNYGANIRCKWTVDGARVNDEVDIRFVDLDVESSPDCTKDRLQIRDISTSYTSPEGIGGPILFNGNRASDWRFRNLGIDTDSILQNYKYCGSQGPPDFFSVGRSVEIIFETDTSGSGRGFQLEYKAAGCNRTYENKQGRLFSPEWPTHSPIFSNCLLVVRSSNGSFVSLYFNEFLMEDSPGCTEAYFEVRENSLSGQLLARYCGSSRPNPIFSQSNVLYINYITKFHPNRGFDITYTTTNAGVGCGGDLFHTGGSFTSPGYPGNYSQESDCRFRIRVPAGLRINLLFTSFMVGGDCASTFLEILTLSSHEITAEPTLFTRYCPGDTPSAFSGTTDMAIVRYKTGRNTTGMGWRAEFRGVTVA